jgi:hypothetical protein
VSAVGCIENGDPHREVAEVLDHVREGGMVAFLSPGDPLFVLFVEPICVFECTTHAPAIFAH